MQSLSKGEEILTGFGAFSVTKRAARTGKNFQTGKAIEIPESDKPKDFIESAPAVLEDSSEEKACDDSLAEVVAEVILLDDSWPFVEILGASLQSNGIKKVDSYYRPDDLLKNISMYSVDTKIFIDNDFKCHISGEDLAKELVSQGFKNLHILSGSPTKNAMKVAGFRDGFWAA